MGFWRTLVGRSAAPRWSGLADAAAFDRFAMLVVAVLAEHDIAADKVLVRTGSVLIRDAEDRELEWMLQELAGGCARAVEDKWRGRIERSFAARRAHEIIAPGSDFAEVDGDAGDRPPRDDQPGGAPQPYVALAQLRLQLFRDDFIGLIDGAITRPVAPGLSAALVEDVAGAMEVTVSRERAAAWGRDDDALFAQASANAIASNFAGINIEPLALDGGKVEIAVSNGFYLGACMLALIDRLPAERGLLVCMLSWHHWVTAPVEATTTRSWCARLAQLIGDVDGRIGVTQTERLGTTLFWYRRDHGFVPLTELLPSLPD